jgi:transcriptional regulator with XRE-family HTH domain
MRALRQAKNYTAEQLAEQVAKFGVPWKRDVVANLENGRRENITVDELAALALALDVPAIELLIDPDLETWIAPHVALRDDYARIWWGGLPVRVPTAYLPDPETVPRENVAPALGRTPRPGRRRKPEKPD